MKRFLYTILLMFAMSSCGKKDIFGVFFGQNPSVEERFHQSDPKGFISEIEAGSNNYRVYVVTDIHVHTTTGRTDTFVNDYISDSSAEQFCLCLGDLVEIKGRMKYAREAFQPIYDAEKQLFISLGNHDIAFSQWEEYRSYFKTSVYQFKVITPSDGEDLYICLDSAQGTLGVDQREWLENALEDARSKSYRNIIIFTHTHFFKRDGSQGITGNFNLEETYYLLNLFSKYGVDYVLTGHGHYYEKTDFREVSFYTLKSLSECEIEGSYYIFTVGRSLAFEEKLLN